MINTPPVDDYMNELDHPFKAEIQAIREIIMGVHPEITEEIKWKAPSFSYKGYMATFNLWEEKRVHLIFHSGVLLDDKSGVLEGDYKDRRMMYFVNMDEVKAKRPALEKLIKEWVKIMDARPPEPEPEVAV